MFRWSLTVIAVFASTSVGFAQYAPGGRCGCENCRPPWTRSRPFPYGQPVRQLDRPNGDFGSNVRPGSIPAPPAPGIVGDDLQPFPMDSNSAPPAIEPSQNGLPPQSPPATQIAPPVE